MGTNSKKSDSTSEMIGKGIFVGTIGAAFFILGIVPWIYGVVKLIDRLKTFLVVP